MNRGWNGLPDISKVLYKETYFLPNETYDEWVLRICNAYANNDEHRNRMVEYINNYWFHPSTPISSNAGTNRGLPISCYISEVGEDSKEGIFDAWQESAWLGSLAGGIGRYWGNIREVGASVGSTNGTSSGIIPFLKVDEALCNSISQGGLRRMSQCDTIDISHPEILEFIDLRKPTGDSSRRALDLHHAVSITDEFMEAVIHNLAFGLKSPKTGKVVKTVKARDLWSKILEARTTTGEPFITYIDTCNRYAPSKYKEEGKKIKASQLCQEIMLHTDKDKTNVCCLASLNLEYWDDYKDIIDQVVADCTDFLDNVLNDFIAKTEGKKGFEKARKGAIEDKALGLGVMGWHSLLQSVNIPFESPMAKGLNQQIFKAIRESSDKHQKMLGQRNLVTLAIAPTMSISNLCNLASSGVEPWISNAFSKKLKQGTFPIRNKHLDQVIRNYAANLPNDTSYDYMNTIEQQWESIKKHNGSVQHLDWMDDWTKDVFKTAFEIKQDVIIDLAGDRSEFIDQGQSINLFIPGNSHVQYISDLHILAWKKGLKSLYYLRSTNPSKASTDSKDRKHININTMSIDEMSVDTCPSCT
jgi:ribonucleoside-diphosphate reductase alpha chain